MDLQPLREFLELSEKKKSLADEQKQVQARLDELEEKISEVFVDEGVNSMSVDGRLVFLRNEVYVGPTENKDALIEALKNEPTTRFMVQEAYQPQTLRSWAKELAEHVREQCMERGELCDEQAVLAVLPEALRGVLKIQFAKSVANRKA